MPRSRAIFIAVSVLFVLALPAGARAAAYNPFTVEAKRKIVWKEGRLMADERVRGIAVREAAPWVPCGGVPPGYTLRVREGYGKAIPFFYELVDAAGSSRNCDGAPGFTDRAPPEGLRLSYRRCGEPRESWLAGEEQNLTPATAEGAPMREVVTLDADDSYEIDYELRGMHEAVCLFDGRTDHQPNQECTEFFAPELCADESIHSKAALGEYQFMFVKTRTPRCGKSKRQERKAKKEIDRLWAKQAAQPGTHSASNIRWIRARIHYWTVARPRRIGDCI